jgi:hypothetical protein
MDTNTSKLSYLMNVTGISGKELAKALYIDHSLISKWKNNRRPLSARSIYLKKIAEYFLSIERISGQDIIKDLLTAYDPQVDTTSREALCSCFCRWLTDPKMSPHIQVPAVSLLHSPQYSYEATYKVYTGNEGRRIAVIQFLECVLSMPEGQQLLLVSQEDMSWLTEDPYFLEMWKEKLTEIIMKKHKIRIIHWVDREIENLSSIINQWLPLHMTGSVESWFYPRYSDTPFKMTLFILQNAAAVSGMTSIEPSKNRYTSFYTDPVTTKQCEWIFNTLVSECRPLIEKYSMKRIDKLLNKFIMEGKIRESSYFYGDVPIFSSMPTKLLEDILIENQVDRAHVEQCVQFHQQLNESFYENVSKYHVRHIYNIEKIEQAAKENSIYCPELSTIAQCDVMISKDHFRQHIYALIEQLNNYQNFEIALVTPPKELQSLPVNLWIKQNGIVMAWPIDGLPFAISASEPTLVNAFYFNYDGKWTSIPRICRSKDWTTKQLLMLVE